jgi:hypothetical protein
MEHLNAPSAIKSRPERVLSAIVTSPPRQTMFSATQEAYGSGGGTRTHGKRINSPFRHNPLTGGYTREPRRSKGFECSPVFTIFH